MKKVIINRVSTLGSMMFLALLEGRMMERVEELSLHLIKQNRHISALEAEKTQLNQYQTKKEIIFIRKVVFKLMNALGLADFLQGSCLDLVLECRDLLFPPTVRFLLGLLILKNRSRFPGICHFYVMMGGFRRRRNLAKLTGYQWSLEILDFVLNFDITLFF